MGAGGMGAMGVGAVGAGMVGAGAMAGAGAMGAPSGASAAGAPSANTGVGHAGHVGLDAVKGNMGLHGAMLNNPTALLAGGMTANLSNLVNQLQGFTTAEILIALLLNSNGDHGKKHCSDAAMMMLAGLAMASHAQGAQSQFTGQIPGMSAGGGAGAVGMQINAQA